MSNRPGTLSRFATRGLAIIGITGLLAGSVAVPVVGRQPTQQHGPSADARIAGNVAVPHGLARPAADISTAQRPKMDAAMSSIADAGIRSSGDRRVRRTGECRAIRGWACPDPTDDR